MMNLFITILTHMFILFYKFIYWMNQSWDLPEWKGSRSQRFYGGRKPLEHHDQLTSFLS